MQLKSIGPYVYCDRLKCDVSTYDECRKCKWVGIVSGHCFDCHWDDKK